MNKERLLILAEHLENGKLGHQKFDFNEFNVTKQGVEAEAYSCGYAGCAIGECPIVFPNDWIFSKNGRPIIKQFDGFDIGVTLNSINKFFDLTSEETDFLFIPNMRLRTNTGFVTYSPGKKATKTQIAKHIRKFVDNGGIYKRLRSKTYNK